MLLRDHPGRKLARGVALDNGHHRLRQNRAMIQFSRDLMHGDTCRNTARVNRPLMRVQTWKRRQQRRVNIDQTAFVAVDKTSGQNAHEACQHDQRGILRINRLGQRVIKRLAARKGFVINNLACDTVRLCHREAFCVRSVADHAAHPCANFCRPIVPLRRAHNRLHVGAAARDQNDDVFHHRIITLQNEQTESETGPMTGVVTLTTIEARVLSTLMEKARTVPDSYPLSLNSLILGCNQKSSREPLMNVTEAQAAQAVDSLKSLNLVRESGAGRVLRFEHNFQRGIKVPEQSAVLLGLLMLRGPQTAGELRLNSERWYKFADISSVDGFLEELQDRSPDKGGPLVVKLPRAPGAREQRWTHLLCGAVDMEAIALQNLVASDSPSDRAELATRIGALEAEVVQLRETVQKLCAELGISSSLSPLVQA